MNKYVVFVFLSVLIFIWCSTNVTVYSSIICLLWCIRIIFTKNRCIIILMIVSYLLVICRINLVQTTSILSQRQSTFQLVVNSATIKVDGDSIKGEGTIKNEIVKFNYKCQTKEEKNFFETLDDDIVLIVHGNLEEYEMARSPNQFNEKDYYFKFKRSFYKLQLAHFTILHRQFNMILKWKKHVEKIISNDLLQLVKTLVFAHIDDTQYFEPFQSLGIMFLFIFSGIHIKAIFKFINYILLKVGVTHQYVKWVIRLLSIIFLWIYGIKSGVVKQIMFALFPRVTKLVLLCSSGLLLLLYNPFLIYHVSFHFAVLISFVYHIVLKKQAFYSMLVLCLSYHYFELNIIGILITKWLSKIVQWLLLPIVWIVALLPHSNWNYLNIILKNVYDLFGSIANIKGLTFVTGRQSLHWYLMYMFIMYLVWQSKNNTKTIVLSIIASICLLPKPAYQFIMLDVEQGDSFIMQNGYDVVMIDTGGQLMFQQKEQWRQKKKRQLSELTTIPVLKSLGISQIHTIICSHADIDHVGELSHIQRKMNVGHIVSAKGAPIPNSTRYVLAGDTIVVGNIIFNVLYPFQSGDGKNEHSIILWTHFLNKKWLFMGDAGHSSENLLLKTYPNLTIDVLKVGHHGSKYSSGETFIQYIKPKIALISVGENNKYNHPHEEIITRLHEATVYQTSIKGTVQFNGVQWITTK